VTFTASFPALNPKGGANLFGMLRLFGRPLHLQDVVQVLGQLFGIAVQSIGVAFTLLQQEQPVCGGETAGEAPGRRAGFSLSRRGLRQQHGCEESEYREENFHGPKH
jgi:hypothetical protein